MGFVTVDDVIERPIEEGTEDILRMAAVEPGLWTNLMQKFTAADDPKRAAGW